MNAFGDALKILDIGKNQIGNNQFGNLKNDFCYSSSTITKNVFDNFLSCKGF